MSIRQDFSLYKRNEPHLCDSRGKKFMKKRILTGIKIFALVFVISVFLSKIFMQSNQGVNKKFNIVTEVPDNLGGVVFFRPGRGFFSPFIILIFVCLWCF